MASAITRERNKGDVVRQPPSSFDTLPSELLSEHRSWQLRIVDSIGVDRAESVSALALELLSVTRKLASQYGTPDLGNKPDPVDELIYIILSRRTREDAYQQAFRQLRSRFSTWSEVLDAPLDQLASIIASSGLGRKKATSIRGALERLRSEFGSCTLEPTRTWTDEAVFGFLCNLPEVGPKSAACVMMCSLGRSAFPVDAHVGRFLARLGTFEHLGLDLVPLDHKRRQTLLLNLVPPSIRYSLHVNAVVHGRFTCRPTSPACATCGVRTLCRRRGLNTGPRLAISGRHAD